MGFNARGCTGEEGTFGVLRVLVDLGREALFCCHVYFFVYYTTMESNFAIFSLRNVVSSPKNVLSIPPVCSRSARVPWVPSQLICWVALGAVYIMFGALHWLSLVLTVASSCWCDFSSCVGCRNH